MNQLDPQRFEHDISEPKALWEGDLVEMISLKRTRDLFRLVNSTSYTSSFVIGEASSD
jgi:hypothetical protein